MSMIKKGMKSNDLEVVSNKEEENEFLVGTKFMVAKELWSVTEEIFTDNTAMRKMVSTSGEQEIRTLRSLQDDLKYGEAILIED